MLIEVRIPAVGESITEGLLAEWLKQDGEFVRTDAPLFVLETDKVTMTVNAENSGQLKVTVAAGSSVKIGEAVGVLDTEGKESTSQRVNEPTVEGGANAGTRGRGDAGKGRDMERAIKVDISQTPGPAINPIAGMASVRAKLATVSSDDEFPPSVRRMLAEYGLDASAIPGTGRGGRLTKGDIVGFLAKRPLVEEEREPTGPRAHESTSDRVHEPTRAAKAEETGPRQTRLPLSPIRTRIAERMLLSQRSTATLTTFNEADLSALVDLRKHYREAFKATHGVDLTYLPFFVKAVSDALDAVPDLASWIEGVELVRNNYRDIGIAVASEQGLSVPVLRDVGRKSLPELQREIEEVARKVRERKITLDDLKGAVFSISNAGSYGALMGTPILNPPQSGILGMYTIQERPVARAGQVVIRPMMYLALSYDHRAVDGKAAGTFLKRVAESVENPGRVLLEV